jgi:hypothetical protein
MERRPEKQQWHKTLLEWMRPFQFNWIGRTRSGVNRWIGAPKGPSERVCRYLMGYGAIMGIVGVIATGVFVSHAETTVPLGALALVGGIHGIVFIALGLWLRKLRRTLAPLKTARELAEEFGSTPETVERLAEAHRITARININGSNLYDPDQFIASRSLLRGASAPYTSDTLLRAAGSHSNESASDGLLRAVDPSEVGLTPIQQLFFAPDEEVDETESAQQTLGR